MNKTGGNIIKEVKISSIQLSLLIIGFIFGSTAIMNPAAAAYQDAWLAYIIGWIGGLFLIEIYILISKFHPEKTLIEILQKVFGKYIGGFLGLLYIGYFIHLAVLVLRNFTDFSVITLYPETPGIFIAVCFSIPVIYVLQNGFEILARFSELVVPLIPVLVIILFSVLIPRYDINNLFPILERGLKPVLKSGFSVLTFPFGESVVLLMIFPLLVEKKQLTKNSYFALIFAGFILFSITIRDLMVLGPDILTKSLFPPIISTRLIPNLNIRLDALIGVNLMIGGGIKGTICLYAAVKGISQLFNCKDYKQLVIPLVIIVIGLSVWIYDDVFDMAWWAINIYPIYAIPFQILIPLLILIFSWVQNKNQNKNK